MNRTSRFLLGYGLMIGFGTVLLRWSIATTSVELTWFEALFTAVSAVCLVGLTVVNTVTDLSVVGQSIVLGLIQGGMLFYLFFAVRWVRQLGGLKVAEEDHSAQSILRRIIIITLLVESSAFVLIFYAGGGFGFATLGEQLFATLFHSVSAFGNAGFSVLPDNLRSLPRAFVLHLAILVTYVLGGLGIDVLYDLFSRKRLRQRLAQPLIDWRLGTRVVVNASIILLGVGGVAFYLLERDNTLAELNLTEKLIGGLFQAATARTAGFHTVDISSLAPLTLGLMTLLMLIGGGAGSAAGGIKITTFYRAFPGRSLHRPDVGRRARAIIIYALGVNLVGTLALVIVEPEHSWLALLFEQVSAFSSVGLSYADTATLSTTGQTVVLLSMLLGRIGILALIMSLTARHRAAGR